MAKIRQHQPAFCSAYEKETSEFNSAQSLLNIPWVVNFRKLINGKPYPEFYRHSIADGNTLMAEYKNGYSWWVVGFIDNPELVKEMPVWASKYISDHK